MMRRTRLLLLPLLFAACAQPEADSAAEKAAGPDEATVRQAVDASNAALIAAFKAGDVAAAVSVYDPNVLLMAPNAPRSAGITENQKMVADFLAQFTVKDFQVTTDEVMIAGDLAITVNTWKMTMAPKAGGPDMSDHGKGLTVFKQQADGSWKIFRDIWNSDVAPQQ